MRMFLSAQWFPYPVRLAERIAIASSLAGACTAAAFAVYVSTGTPTPQHAAEEQTIEQHAQPAERQTTGCAEQGCPTEHSIGPFSVLVHHNNGGTSRHVFSLDAQYDCGDPASRAARRDITLVPGDRAEIVPPDLPAGYDDLGLYGSLRLNGNLESVLKDETSPGFITYDEVTRFNGLLPGLVDVRLLERDCDKTQASYLGMPVFHTADATRPDARPEDPVSPQPPTPPPVQKPEPIRDPHIEPDRSLFPPDAITPQEPDYSGRRDPLLEAKKQRQDPPYPDKIPEIAIDIDTLYNIQMYPARLTFEFPMLKARQGSSRLPEKLDPVKRKDPWKRIDLSAFYGKFDFSSTEEAPDGERLSELSFEGDEIGLVASRGTPRNRLSAWAIGLGGDDPLSDARRDYGPYIRQGTLGAEFIQKLFGPIHVGVGAEYQTTEIGIRGIINDSAVFEDDVLRVRPEVGLTVGGYHSDFARLGINYTFDNRNQDNPDTEFDEEGRVLHESVSIIQEDVLGASGEFRIGFEEDEFDRPRFELFGRGNWYPEITTRLTTPEEEVIDGKGESYNFSLGGRWWFGKERNIGLGAEYRYDFEKTPFAVDPYDFKEPPEFTEYTRSVNEFRIYGTYKFDNFRDAVSDAKRLFKD